MARFDFNRVFLVGRLTHEPELKYTQKGTAVANFSIAVNRNYTDSSGARQEETDYLRVVVWSRQAENCKNYLVKGQQVFIEGSLRSRTYEDKEGRKVNVVEVVASRVQFLDKPRGASGDSNPSGYTENTRFDDNESHSEDDPDDDIPF